MEESELDDEEPDLGQEEDSELDQVEELACLPCRWMPLGWERGLLWARSSLAGG